MRNHVIAELEKVALADSRVMLLTADLGFSVVENFAKLYPKRYVNVGIAEQNLAGIAAGLALEGNMVFVYSIGNFPTLRCIEQIRNLICYHNANVKILAVGGGFAYGDLGMTHHATEDIAMMRALPNMRVYVPSDVNEAVSCFRELISYDGPGYLRMARGKERNIFPEGYSFHTSGVNCLKKCGSDVNILFSGTIGSESVKLQQLLEESGIDCGLYSLPHIKPINQADVLDIAKRCKLIVTMEEHNVIGGLGGAVAETLASERNHARLMRTGLQDVFTSEVGNQEYLRDYYGLSASKLFVPICEVLEELK